MSVSWIYYVNEPQLLDNAALRKLWGDERRVGDAIIGDDDVGVLFSDGDGERTVYYGKSYASLAADFAELAAKLAAAADRAEQ